MSVLVRTIGPMAILPLAPILTYMGGRDLVTRLLALSPSHVHWLLDMSAVNYIDSAGLGALIDLRVQLQERGGSLKLLRSTARAKHLLALTGLGTFLRNFDSEADALASVPVLAGEVS